MSGTGRAVKLMRVLVPGRIRAAIKEMAGITALEQRTLQLEELVLPAQELRLRSKSRWTCSAPDPNLTWGKELAGDAFVARVQGYGGFHPEASVLELGPGYGRILASCLKLGLAFREYTGVDISNQNIAHLEQRFADSANLRFVKGDFELISFDRHFDLILSSLTFKHLYPTFERALANVAQYVRPGGKFFFDLIEGEGRRFEADGVTYVRRYAREEVVEILNGIGISLMAFDEVQHAPGFVRLLVIARK